MKSYQTSADLCRFFLLIIFQKFQASFQPTQNHTPCKILHFQVNKHRYKSYVKKITKNSS